jgi:hypothetical protein
MKLTETELLNLRNKGIDGKLEANKLLSKKVNAELLKEELEICKNDIIYFKDNYLINLDKIESQDEIIIFVQNNKISEINLEMNEYKSVATRVCILHTLIFEINEIIGVAGDANLCSEEIANIKKIYNELPKFFKSKGKFLKSSIELGSNKLIFDNIDEKAFRGFGLTQLYILENKANTDYTKFLDSVVPSMCINSEYKIVKLGEPIFKKPEYLYKNTQKSISLTQKIINVFKNLFKGKLCQIKKRN